MRLLNRRSAIVASCAAVIGAHSKLSALEPTKQASMSIVDTHQHLWDLKQFTLPWHAESKNPVLTRSYLPSDYATATAECNVVKAVYMEVDVVPEQQNKEADYVLNLCRQENSLTKAAVISCRPADPGFGRYMERFANEPKIKGVRQVLHGPTPAGFCLGTQFVNSMNLLGEMGKSYDLCMRPSELLDAVKLVDRCTKTKFILDHCGNGPVRSDDQALIKKWQEGVRELSQRPHVMCKISGIVASAPADWQAADLAPVINFCLDAFGEDRVMFAGDWPVCLLRATFKQWVDALQSIVASRSDSFRTKLFHDNAVKFYGL